MIKSKFKKKCEQKHAIFNFYYLNLKHTQLWFTILKLFIAAFQKNACDSPVENWILTKCASIIEQSYKEGSSFSFKHTHMLTYKEGSSFSFRHTECASIIYQLYKEGLSFLLQIRIHHFLSQFHQNCILLQTHTHANI